MKKLIKLKNHTQSIQNALSLVSDSLRGKEYDYTSGSLRKGVMLLAIPMILEMGMESLFAVVDIFFVAQLGSHAVAVVGITEAVITLVYALAIGFGMGVTAVVARRIGEKSFENANLTAVQAIIIGAVISALIGAIGFLYSGEILKLMGADEQVVAIGGTYTQIMIGGNGTFFMLFVVSAIFRGAGNPFIAMRALWLANAINIVLDPCLIFGWGLFPELGVTGAAIATNIGRTVGVLYLIYHLFNGRSLIQLSFRTIHINITIALGLLKVSLGGILQFLIATASWVFLMRIVAQFGSDAIAGYTIAMRISMFTFLPAWGLSNAAATLVGQNLGAKNPVRAEKSVWITAKYNFMFMGTASIITLLFADLIVGFFTTQMTAQIVGITCLTIVALGYPLFGLGMVFTQAFNGSGDTKTPTKINLFCFWVIQIPFAWFAANWLMLHTVGVAIAVTLGESLVAFIAWQLFRRGKWKRTEV